MALVLLKKLMLQYTLGNIRILSHTSNAKLYLLKLIFYIMKSKKVIIKMDINETCILENSLASYSQEIYKGWKIFYPIYSSTEVLFQKFTDHPINIYLLDL